MLNHWLWEASQVTLTFDAYRSWPLEETLFTDCGVLKYWLIGQELLLGLYKRYPSQQVYYWKVLKIGNGDTTMEADTQ